MVSFALFQMFRCISASTFCLIFDPGNRVPLGAVSKLLKVVISTMEYFPSMYGRLSFFSDPPRVARQIEPSLKSSKQRGTGPPLLRSVHFEQRKTLSFDDAHFLKQ